MRSPLLVAKLMQIAFRRLTIYRIFRDRQELWFDQGIFLAFGRQNLESHF
jgi:hypothetical protein